MMSCGRWMVWLRTRAWTLSRKVKMIVCLLVVILMSEASAAPAGGRPPNGNLPGGARFPPRVGNMPLRQAEPSRLMMPRPGVAKRPGPGVPGRLGPKSGGGRALPPPRKDRPAVGHPPPPHGGGFRPGPPPPPHYRSWRRGPRPHHVYRSRWYGGIWYDDLGYPYYGPSTMTIVRQPVVVLQPVIVQEPVVVQPPPVVQKPVAAVEPPQLADEAQTPPIATNAVPARQVWIEGRYVEETQVDGTVIRVYQPGHYEKAPVSESRIDIEVPVGDGAGSPRS